MERKQFIFGVSTKDVGTDMKRKNGLTDVKYWLAEQDGIKRTWKVNSHQCPEENVLSRRKRHSYTLSLLMISFGSFAMYVGGRQTLDDLRMCVIYEVNAWRIPANVTQESCLWICSET